MSENKYPIGGYAPLKQLLDDLIECVINDRLILGATPNGRPHDPDPEIDRLRSEILSLYGNKPAGAVWVKGDYDQLYEQLKADPEKRIACYVDYDYWISDIRYTCRDICSINGEMMEFQSRGHGYGSVRFIPGDYKENFIELCKQMNVERLDDSGTASNKDAIDFAEWILENNIEATLNDKGKLWVDFRLPRGKNKFTTTDLHKLWQQSKSKV